MSKFSEYQVKDAFQKVKKDIDSINLQFSDFRQEIYNLRQEMISVCKILENLSLEIKDIKEVRKEGGKIEKNNQNSYIPTPTDQQLIQTIPTDNPTHLMPLKPLKPLNKVFSTGNRGVPTDRQTDRQTDNIRQKSPIQDAAEILDSLDILKKEIRIKFKQLTDQEVLVFSTLYQLEEEQGPIDYKTLADKLGLTESSIRDYIGRLLKKGSPSIKIKLTISRFN